MGEVNQHKVTEYKESYRYWTDKRISQMSFHNNLLLTLGMAVVGYFWKERSSVYTNILIDKLLPIDWVVVLFILGMVFLFFSIVIGFTLSLSRLYDLRLTSHIALTKKRLAEKGIMLKNERRYNSTLWSSLRSFLFVLRKPSKYTIKNSDLCAEESITLQETELNEIRDKSDDLGYFTWAMLKLQTLCMLISIILLIVVLVTK